MAVRKVANPSGGPDLTVDFQPFQAETEPWSVYRLEDGLVVRLRVTATELGRILDDQGQPAAFPSGEPRVFTLYLVQVAPNPAPAGAPVAS
jgi:hypothetical protein